MKGDSSSRYTEMFSCIECYSTHLSSPSFRALKAPGPPSSLSRPSGNVRGAEGLSGYTKETANSTDPNAAMKQSYSRSVRSRLLSLYRTHHLERCLADGSMSVLFGREDSKNIVILRGKSAACQVSMSLFSPPHAQVHHSSSVLAYPTSLHTGL